jgi:hypothetical protein
MNQLQYVALNTLNDVSGVQPISEEDKTCLAEVRDVLKKFGKLDRFGITLLHKHFDLLDDEILVESVDEENRTQVIKPMKRSDVDKMEGEILETMWSLEDNQVLMACKIKCVQQGGKHYERHVHSF